jgi:hypothetical protein
LIISLLEGLGLYPIIFGQNKKRKIQNPKSKIQNLKSKIQNPKLIDREYIVEIEVLLLN